MADEEKNETTDTGQPAFETKDDLTKFLMDMQGQMATMQETIDKLSPVEDEKPTDEEEEKPTDEEPTEEEVNEIDQLLQSE